MVDTPGPTSNYLERTYCRSRFPIGGLPLAGFALLLNFSLAAQEKVQVKQATPEQQFKAIRGEFGEAARGLYEATTDEERRKVTAQVEKLSPRCLELAEKNSNNPIALDALIQVINQELWLQNNSQHPGRGKDGFEGRAIAQLLRNHLRSERLDEASWRTQYGFSKDCETFLRTVLDKSPHKQVQGMACLRLAQFLNARLQRLDLLNERPDMVKRYQGWFGKEYLEAMQRQDRGAANKEVETLFERAADKFGDLKMPYGGLVAAKAKSELHEIRHLAVGKDALDIVSDDQDGKRFKLSDYRGKVVLLYFWSEY